ncbi:MAG: sulfotransferase domain-containing protein [Myxococcales bacterium]|nr:sulfotransferase domain-containing protein [Myxococcales bacterium]MDD9966005.1 sulfotransferase domain-containing protein [Myxococcales bacterium]
MSQRAGELPRRISIQALALASAAAEEVGERMHDGARVARFLRGRLEFTPQPDDIFISSYPRSGTTWLQQMLLVLARDGEPHFDHISDVVPWFERSLSLGIRRGTSFDQLPRPRIFKSHLPYAWLPHGARYVYALRDGRDVVVSYYHLYRSHLRYRGDFDSFFDRFMRGDLQYKSWFKHTAGWQTVAHRDNVRVVRYERMLNDMLGVMRELNTFLRFDRTPQRIEDLSRYCTFDYMKSHEQRFDHATEERHLRGMSDGRFLRQGGSGGFSKYLNDDQLRSFERSCARTRRTSRVELDLPAFLH